MSGLPILAPMAPGSHSPWFRASGHQKLLIGIQFHELGNKHLMLAYIRNHDGFFKYPVHRLQDIPVAS